jgi:acyl-CoA dehydrogenase
MASVMLAEELGRSTFGGFSATVLVHTDMASPHLENAGTPEQKARWMPAITSGEKITAVADDVPIERASFSAWPGCGMPRQ